MMSVTEASREPGSQIHAQFGLLYIACVFAIVGGYLDAYSYLAHGSVFANAQTGNVIFLGVYLSEGQWGRALRHLPPIAAFALGVATAKTARVKEQKKTFRATLLCQLIEIVVLGGLVIGEGRITDAWVVPSIAYAAALQNTSFSTIGPWSFNSTMTTGNLRSSFSGLVEWLAGRERIRNRDQFIALGSICLTFFLGALVGGLCTRWNTRWALVPCVALVAVGSSLTWLERRRVARLNEPASPVA